MRIYVHCGERGEIRSVAVPNPELAGRIQVEVEGGGRVHALEVDGGELDLEALRDPKNDRVRRQLHDRLRALI
jgi:hypothetical protein